MRSLPPGLVAEVRLAFQTCSRQHAASKRTQFSTFRPLFKKSPPSKKKDHPPIQVVHSQLQAQKAAAAKTAANKTTSKDLVPRSDEAKSLDTGRKVEVPLKVIPKADIAPNLTLSPKERLQIEQLTRRLPPRAEPQVYKQKLRIYSAGNGRIYFITFLRFTAILGLLFVTVIVAPAHWMNGSSLLFVASLWLAGFVPFAFINWTLRPMVTEIFLRLPQSAQHSPKAAMAYAQSLPADAILDLRFMRTTTLADSLSLKLANTRPVKSYFRPISFEWFGPLVERGGLLRPNPTQFYVRPQSAGGRAARDVTPGIWSNVYERLTGLESKAVAKWRRVFAMSEAAPTKPALVLTARETEILLGALQNVKGGDLQIEYGAMATAIGVKDGRSACARWSEVKKKLSLGGKLTSATATAGEASGPKPRTPRKPKDPNGTAAAKPTKRTPKSAVAVKEDDDEGEAADADADGPASPTAEDAEMNEQETPATPTTPKAPETPTPAQTSTGKKRGRKTKAEKDAEAAAAAAAGAANGENAGDDDEEKPAKKPRTRKTPVKKKTDATDGTGEETAEAATPSKARKPAARKPAAKKGAAAATATVTATEPATETEQEPDSAALALAAEEKGKKDKIAADAALANDVLTGKVVAVAAPKIGTGTGPVADDDDDGPASTSTEEDEDAAVVVEDAGEIAADDTETETVTVIQTEIVAAPVSA
ncbi:hypothetical protein H2202_006307 [Exophiala xenobiotica]|nr:hypothetical protein H2202_006307 [Exophiala xenobiotica]